MAEETISTSDKALSATQQPHPDCSGGNTLYSHAQQQAEPLTFSGSKATILFKN